MTKIKLSNTIQAQRMTRHLIHMENKEGRKFSSEEVKDHNMLWISKYAGHFRRWFIKAPKWKIHTSEGFIFDVVGKKHLYRSIEEYNNHIRLIEKV